MKAISDSCRDVQSDPALWFTLAPEMHVAIALKLGKRHRRAMRCVDHSMRSAVDVTVTGLDVWHGGVLPALCDLKRFPRLRYLRLFDISESDLQHIPLSIKSLDLSESTSATTAKGFEHLQRLSLEVLNIDHGCTNGELADIDFTGHCLRSLSARNITLNEKPLNNILSLSTLQTLDIRASGILGAGITQIIAKLPLLSLAADLNDLDIACIKQLATSTTLQTLSLANTEIDDDCLPFLCAIPTLTKLDVCCNEAISTTGIALLASNPRLRYLTVGGPAEPGQIADVFKQNTSIRWLKLNGANIQDEGLRVLWQNTSLTALTITHDLITADALAGLPPHRSIHAFSLTHNAGSIGPEGAKALVSLQFRHLKFDIGGGSKRAVGYTLKEASQLEAMTAGRDFFSLKSLVLEGASFNDYHLNMLPASIKALGLRSCNISAAGLETLRFYRLKKINLYETAQDVQRDALMKTLPSLKVFSTKRGRDESGDEAIQQMETQHFWQQYYAEKFAQTDMALQDE